MSNKVIRGKRHPERECGVRGVRECIGEKIAF